MPHTPDRVRGAGSAIPVLHALLKKAGADDVVTESWQSLLHECIDVCLREPGGVFPLVFFEMVTVQWHHWTV